MFNRLCAILKATSAEAKGRAARTVTNQKQAMQKTCLPTGIETAAFELFTALPLELEKTSPHMLNFVYLNPAICLFYDFKNKSIVMFLMFAGGNPKAAGSISAGRQLFHSACVWVVAVLVALP